MAHEEAIKTLAQHMQQNPPAAAQDRAAKLDNLIDTIMKITEIPVVKQKLGLESDPIDNELTNLGQLVTKGIKRQMASAYVGSVKSFTRKGFLFPEETEGIIEQAAEKHVHGI